jgi:succinyl-CoA synthetase beta subunit
MGGDVNLLEHQGKYLLARAGMRVPQGTLVFTPEEAADAARRIGGRIVCKAQIPAGKRGKAGAVQLVDGPEEALAFAQRLLGTEVSGYEVTELVVEEAADIAREFYAAVLDDPSSKGPLVLFSTEGGMDIEEVNAASPHLVHRAEVDIRTSLDHATAGELLERTDLDAGARSAVADALVRLYDTYRNNDAVLVEVNPLALTKDGSVIALDAKVTIDPGSVPRQAELLDSLPGGRPAEQATDLELRGRELGLQYIELDGDVGVLANGAGLTMTTLDAVNHFGGSPANFLEIGGDAYTKATQALELVLSNPNVKSLLVNFCGAFARTDVMTEGVINAIDGLKPTLPISFTIHGTGEDEAIALVRQRLGKEPHDLMDDAVQEAIRAAAQASTGRTVETKT